MKHLFDKIIFAQEEKNGPGTSNWMQRDLPGLACISESRDGMNQRGARDVCNGLPNIWMYLRCEESEMLEIASEFLI